MKYPNYIFDTRGLRFSKDVLKNAYIRADEFTLNEAAEYVDAITYTICSQSNDYFINTMNHLETEGIDTDNFNVTSLGNVAFVALHHADEITRNRSVLLFLQVQKLFRDKLKKTLNMDLP